jgi:hypothetical protein
VSTAPLVLSIAAVVALALPTALAAVPVQLLR